METLQLFLAIYCIGFMGCRPTPPPPPYSGIPSNNTTYVKLSDEIKVQYRYITNRNMRFKYQEDYNDAQMEYVIYNDRHQVVQTQVNVAMAIQYGSNDCILALQLNTGRYILEVTNEKNVKKYLHFYLNPPYDISVGENSGPGPISQ